MVDAREYHERTKHSPESVRANSHRLDPRTKPRPYKIYRDLPAVDPAEAVEGPETPALEAIATTEPEPDSSTPNVGGTRNSESFPLHTLCHYATGVTKTLRRQGQKIPYRAAACTGKLYHVDLYAVTGDCGPAGPGVYHFDPHEDRFDLLREGDYRSHLARAAGERERVDREKDAREAVDRATGVAAAPVTLVATSTWWRNAWKYRERTFRHAFWDSGTILANLLATAHGLGYRAGVVGAFSEDPVVELLALDPAEEAPLELVPVGAGDPVGGSDSVGGSDPGTVGEPDSAGNPDVIRSDDDIASLDPATEPLSPEQEEYPLVPDAWEQGTLEGGKEAADWRERVGRAEPADLGRVGPGDGRRVDLEPVDAETASARPVGTTIERRGSCREYSHEPITARKFATVLDRALGGLPAEWTGVGHSSDEASQGGETEDTADARSPGRFVDCYCLVHAVEGIEAGAYQYHAGETALEHIGDTDRETAGHLALDQGVVGDAAVNVYLLADVDAVVSAVGNRGYRLAQLEGGLALGRLYLATYAHRTLGGRGFTFYDDLVTEHLSPRATDQTPMTLFAFGRPA